MTSSTTDKPYTVRRGEFKDLSKLYAKTKIYKLDKIVFYDSIFGQELTYNHFKDTLKDQVFVITEHGPNILGYCWLENFRSASAEIHFCTFFNEWVSFCARYPEWRTQPLIIGREAISLLFESVDKVSDLYQLESVHGYIPGFNKQALAFTETIGFKRGGALQNAIKHDGVLQNLNIVTLLRKEVKKWADQ
jgi:hypothetical protein